jgi:hypothetical protein
MNPTPATYQPVRAKLPRFILGVDPDCTASGVVLFDRQTKTFPVLCCMPDHTLREFISSRDPETILIVVEAGWLNGGMWHGKDTTGWDGNKAKAYGAAIAKSVGRNHMVGQSLLTYCEVKGYRTDTYRPAGRKWKKQLFMRITGLPKGFNEEIRDSVRAIHSFISDCL